MARVLIASEGLVDQLVSALTDLEKPDVAEIVQAGNLNDKDVMTLFCSLLLSMAGD